MVQKKQKKTASELLLTTFSTDKSLVNAVHEAFRLLGFDNLKKSRRHTIAVIEKS